MPTDPDHPQDTESQDLISHESESNALLSKPKNWPSFKPVLRHSIKEDIPKELQSVMRFALGHCFFVLFVLFLNFGTGFFVYFMPYERYPGSAFLLTSIVLSSAWLLLWGAVPFVIYGCLYRAIAWGRTGCYRAFAVGTIARAVLAALAAVGPPYTGMHGFVLAFSFSEVFPVIVLSAIVGVLFALDFLCLLASLAVTHARRSALSRAGPLPVADDAEVSGMAGAAGALPSEVGGRRITYLPARAGQRRGKAGTEALAALPENSLTVVDEWVRAAGGDGGGEYVLYVEGDHERSYWSDAHVAGIIENGEVDASTQVLIISRLGNGEFVFGVADKK